jgi:hypothetical protein
MIKPIIYSSFQEKEILERKLMSHIPFEKRQSVSKALSDIFYNPDKGANLSIAAKTKSRK